LLADLFDAAGETVFLIVEVGEDLAFDQTGEGGGEGVDFGVEIASFGVGLGRELAGFDREEARFEGRDAAEAPFEIGEFDDEGMLDGVLRAIVIDADLVVEVVSGGVLGGEEGVAGGESMREGVTGGGEFSFVGLGAGREFGVRVVGGELEWGRCH
jgi:hypothetical protein